MFGRRICCRASDMNRLLAVFLTRTNQRDRQKLTRSRGLWKEYATDVLTGHDELRSDAACRTTRAFVNQTTQRAMTWSTVGLSDAATQSPPVNARAHGHNRPAHSTAGISAGSKDANKRRTEPHTFQTTLQFAPRLFKPWAVPVPEWHSQILLQQAIRFLCTHLKFQDALRRKCLWRDARQSLWCSCTACSNM